MKRGALQTGHERLFKQLLPKSRAFFIVLLAERGGKLFEQLFLLGGKVLGRFDHYAHGEIAAALIVIDIHDALAAQLEGVARLGALGNGELLGFSTEHRHVDLGAECCLNEGDRHLAIDISAIALEDLMRLYVHLDDEII